MFRVSIPCGPQSMVWTTSRGEQTNDPASSGTSTHTARRGRGGAIGDVQGLDSLWPAVDGVDDIAGETDDRPRFERNVDDHGAAGGVLVAHAVAAAASQDDDQAVDRVGVKLDDLGPLGRARRIEDDTGGPRSSSFT